MSEEQECEECEAGAPAWLATFADLMSLLMCFFVLLLSFSEMDIQKYKQVAGSMVAAFGVQRTIKVDSIPQGTSIIKKEFSPGRPEPTVINVLKQKTSENTQRQIEVNTPLSKDIEHLLKKVERSFSEEINENRIDVVVFEDSVMIRVREADAFPSGEADIQPEFVPILDKLINVIEEGEGKVVVGGHTDNVPISSRAYPSNWVLSAARAASVVHYLSEVKYVDANRMEIRAYADTQPVADNDTIENRARNRRIEINISVDAEEE